MITASTFSTGTPAAFASVCAAYLITWFMLFELAPVAV